MRRGVVDRSSLKRRLVVAIGDQHVTAVDAEVAGDAAQDAQDAEGVFDHVIGLIQA
jgi:hypothetical protein